VARAVRSGEFVRVAHERNGRTSFHAHVQGSANVCANPDSQLQLQVRPIAAPSHVEADAARRDDRPTLPHTRGTPARRRRPARRTGRCRTSRPRADPPRCLPTRWTLARRGPRARRARRAEIPPQRKGRSPRRHPKAGPWRPRRRRPPPRTSAAATRGSSGALAGARRRRP
jgi:hypothetical protein